MNILILTGCFGMGHYKASEALKENLKAINPNANIYTVDIIDYMFPKSNKIIYKLFDIMVGRCCKLYNVLNKLAEKWGAVPFENSGIKKIEKMLKEYDANLIVSTFPLSSKYISAYKEKTDSKIPLYTYITDIVVNDEWIAENTDLYFVGSNKTKELLESRGVKKDKIIISGIPVAKKFDSKDNVNKNKGKKEILIMGGGLGLITFSDDLLNKLTKNSNISVTVITGKNKKLKDKLELKFKNINVIGYVDNVEYYMKKADLLITKPGGITTFEAIYCQTPLFIICPNLIQEIGNAKFIDEENIGHVIWSKKRDEICSIDKLIEDETVLEKMKNNMFNIKSNLSDICPKEYFI